MRILQYLNDNMINNIYTERTFKNVLRLQKEFYKAYTNHQNTDKPKLENKLENKSENELKHLGICMSMSDLVSKLDELIPINIPGKKKTPMIIYYS